MSNLVLFDVPGPRTRRRMVVVNVVAALVVAGIAAWALVLLDRKGQLEPAMWEPFAQPRTWTAYLLPGLLQTLRAAGLAIVGSAVFGLVFGMGRLSGSRVVRAVSGTVVEFFRAVPVLLMMVFFYSGIAQLRVVDPPDVPLLAVVLALTLYNGSVFAELVRSGVHNLPKGQREAALVVGLRPSQSLRLVEVPQALIAMLPAIASQLVVILKDTALGAIITYPELLDAARRFGSGNGNMLQALLIAALVFIVINYALTTLAERLASRVGRLTAGDATAETPAMAATTTR